MRTLILNYDFGADTNIENVERFFIRGGYAIDRDLTGLFAFEDRASYLIHKSNFGRERINGYEEPSPQMPLPLKMKTAIRKWCDTGLGYAIIHGRNYPPRQNGRRERIPYKIDANRYFFHLGGYGGSTLWHNIRRARSMKTPTNEATYNTWKEMTSDSSHPMAWIDAHTLEDDQSRSFSSFIWNNGSIEKKTTWAEGEEDDRRYLVYEHRPAINPEASIFLPALNDIPQWQHNSDFERSASGETHNTDSFEEFLRAGVERMSGQDNSEMED